MNNIINKLPNSHDATTWGQIISEQYIFSSQYGITRHLIVKNDLGIFKVISYDLEWKNIIINKNEVTLYCWGANNQIINFIDEINISDLPSTNNSFFNNIYF